MVKSGNNRSKNRSSSKSRRSKQLRTRKKQLKQKTKQIQLKSRRKRSSKRKYQKRVRTQRKSKKKRGGFFWGKKKTGTGTSLKEKWKASAPKRSYIKRIANIKAGKLKVNGKLASLSASCKLMESLQAPTQNKLREKWCDNLKNDKRNFVIRAPIKMPDGTILKMSVNTGAEGNVTLNGIDKALDDVRAEEAKAKAKEAEDAAKARAAEVSAATAAAADKPAASDTTDKKSTSEPKKNTLPNHFRFGGASAPFVDLATFDVAEPIA